jgi:hypothetical protein
MQNNSKMFLLAVSSAVVMTFGAQLASAQITNTINAHLTHKFTIGDTTLPPGQYTFRMAPDTDLSVMSVRSLDGNIAEDFLVRESRATDMPKHSELIFDRYGKTELLDKIYEQGSRTGVAVVEPSMAESRLQKQGQHPVQHTEEQ